MNWLTGAWYGGTQTVTTSTTTTYTSTINNAMTPSTRGLQQPFVNQLLAQQQIGTAPANGVWFTNAISLPPLGDRTYSGGRLKINHGKACVITLPNKAQVKVKRDGSYEIDDADATVIYKAPRHREFNKYINASDLLEEFVRYCGREAHVRKREMLDLPVSLFVGWLALEAARADHEALPQIDLLPDLRRAAAPRCEQCGRFLRLDLKRRGVAFCGPGCFMKKFTALGPGEPAATVALPEPGPAPQSVAAPVSEPAEVAALRARVNELEQQLSMEAPR